MDRRTLRSLELSLAVSALAIFVVGRTLWYSEVTLRMLFYFVCGLLLAAGADLALAAAARKEASEAAKTFRLVAVLYCAILGIAAALLCRRIPEGWYLKEASALFVSVLVALNVFGIVTDLRRKEK